MSCVGSPARDVRQLFAGVPGTLRRSCIFGVLSLFVLAGCAQRPTGVLLPVAETAPDASIVNMLVTTTRGHAAAPGEMFGGERAREAAFAELSISIPPDKQRKIGEVAWPRKLPADARTDFATLKAKEISRSDAESWLRTAVAKSPDHSVLVFIHGFNNHFEDSVYRFAQIVHDSHAHSVPVLVTWPSRGSVLAYGYDRESTNYTRNALENLFQYLGRDPQVKEVSVLAHSMGNSLALESLRQMAIRNGRLPAKFKNVMMAAPDIDIDVFRSQIADMGNPRPQFTLFVSRDDRALAVSRRVWGNVARVGSVDPEQEPYKEEFAANHINVIDLTNQEAIDSLNHSKFAESPEIVQLIGGRLGAGQTLTDNRIGLGDAIVNTATSAAQVAGTAAGLAIAAPVSLADRQTRENYSNNVSELSVEISGAQTGGKPVVIDCGDAKSVDARACAR